MKKSFTEDEKNLKVFVNLVVNTDSYLYLRYNIINVIFYQLDKFMIYQKKPSITSYKVNIVELLNTLKIVPSLNNRLTSG